jgi:hypothetical protein
MFNKKTPVTYATEVFQFGVILYQPSGKASEPKKFFDIENSQISGWRYRMTRS